MGEMMILATSQGVVICERKPGEWSITGGGLLEKKVTSVTVQHGVILVGTDEGIYRSDDVGESWTEASKGLSFRHVRWLAYHPDIADLTFAGTEPASIFISGDGGKRWRECSEVGELRQRFGWFLPYSPEAGCVRGFAIHGARVYAAVEVGGVLVSDNTGESWGLARGSRGDTDLFVPDPYIHPDVHSIEVHPDTADLVYAPTGGGFYRSMDGGATWRALYRCYCRAVWINPRDADHIILGPADGVDRNGRIEESQDGGRTWTPAASGLGVSWQNTMVERFYQVGDDLMAILSNGDLLVASLASLTWKRFLPEAGRINDLTVLTH